MDVKFDAPWSRNVPIEAQPIPVANIATSPPINNLLAACSPPKALRVGPRAAQAETAGGRETSSPPPHYVVNYSVDYEDLEFYEHLGAGRYGSVSRALIRSRNAIVAVKKVDSLGQEVHILSQLSHRNVVRFYGVYSHVLQTPAGRQLQFGIITEFCDNGSLHDLLKRIRPQLSDEMPVSESAVLSFANILQWAADVARGMNYLHSEAPFPIIHRDLKSTNVLLSRDWMCKICDFGSSRMRNRDNSIISVAGTPAWMAPELIRGEANCSSGCDVWSFGVVLWELLTCEQPFKGLEQYQVMYVVGSRSEHPPIPGSCPLSFHELLKRCWLKEATARPTFAEIIVELAKMLTNTELPSELTNFTSNSARKVWLLEVEVELQRVNLLKQSLEEREHDIAEREQKLNEQKKLIETQLMHLNPSGSQSHLHPSSLSSLERLDVLNWSELDVARWVLSLNHCGLSRYATLFEANHISGRRLLLLSKHDFQAMGIMSLGHQKQFIDEISFLRVACQLLIDFPPLQITSSISVQNGNAITPNNDAVFAVGSEDDSLSSSSDPSTPVPADISISTTPLNTVSAPHTPVSVKRSNSNRIYVENREFFVNMAVGMYSFPYISVNESGTFKESTEYRVFLDGHVSFDPSTTLSSPDDAIGLTDVDLTLDIANVFSTVFVTFDPEMPTEKRICAATGSHGSTNNLAYSAAPYVAKETSIAKPFSSVEVEITLRQPYCCYNRQLNVSDSACETIRGRLSSRGSTQDRTSGLVVAVTPPEPVVTPPAIGNPKPANPAHSFEFIGVIRKRLVAHFNGPVVTWSVPVTRLATRTCSVAEDTVNTLTSPLDENSISLTSTSTTRSNKISIKTPHSPHLSLASITSPTGDDPIQFYSEARRNSISQLASPNERPSSPAAVMLGQQVKAANEQNRLPYLFSPISPGSLSPPVKTYASVAASAKQLTSNGVAITTHPPNHQNGTFHGHYPNHHQHGNNHQASASPTFRHAIRNNQRKTSQSSGGSGGDRNERNERSGNRQYYAPGKSGGGRYSASSNKFQ